MTPLARAVEKLSRAHQGFLRAAEGVPEKWWRTPPAQGAWSAAEVVAHIIGVESTVVATTTRILQKEPKHIPLRKRFRFPPLIVERRLIRIKTPIPVDQQLLGSKHQMLAGLQATRDQTLALMEETKSRDLSVYRWKHPVLGMLDAYGWFAFLGSHQIRHEKQLREIAAALRKPVADLQK